MANYLLSATRPLLAVSFLSARMGWEGEEWGQSTQTTGGDHEVGVERLGQGRDGVSFFCSHKPVWTSSSVFEIYGAFMSGQGEHTFSCTLFMKQDDGVHTTFLPHKYFE